MANEQLIITGIEYKVRKIIEKNNFLIKENSELKKELREREDRLSLLTGELESKKSELLKITLAKLFEREFGVEESTSKLLELIAEIDRSIEVLSD